MQREKSEGDAREDELLDRTLSDVAGEEVVHEIDSTTTVSTAVLPIRVSSMQPKATASGTPTATKGNDEPGATEPFIAPISSTTTPNWDLEVVTALENAAALPVRTASKALCQLSLDHSPEQTGLLEAAIDAIQVLPPRTTSRTATPAAVSAAQDSTTTPSSTAPLPAAIPINQSPTADRSPLTSTPTSSPPHTDPQLRPLNTTSRPQTSSSASTRPRISRRPTPSHYEKDVTALPRLETIEAGTALDSEPPDDPSSTSAVKILRKETNGLGSGGGGPGARGTVLGRKMSNAKLLLSRSGTNRLQKGSTQGRVSGVKEEGRGRKKKEKEEKKRREEEEKSAPRDWSGLGYH